MTTAPVTAPVSAALVPLSAFAQKAHRAGLQFVDLDSDAQAVSEAALALMQAHEARSHNALPVDVSGEEVTLAVEDPNDLAARQALSRLFPGHTVRLVCADPAAIRRKVEAVYSAAVEAARLDAAPAPEFGAGRAQAQAFGGGDLGRVESRIESEYERLLNLAIEQGLRDGASDIHIEPVRAGVEIRQRVDGGLRTLGSWPSAMGDGLIRLIKVQADMATDNPLVPDSGALVHNAPGLTDPVDIRVETAPTAWGTEAVLRLQNEIWRDLSTLGFSPANERRFRWAIEQPYGMVLATGPTSHGKSTTLFSALRELMDPRVKIITLEDPIEFKAPRGITQTQINEGQGMTYPVGLRSILRRNPDIVMIGEIRDRETAEVAVGASLTGQLLLSTLHTNDAAGCIPRLARMGVEPTLLADAVLAVVGQRLARRLCETCRIEVPADHRQIQDWGFDAGRVPTMLEAANPMGCNDCGGSGYRGRIAIHEVLVNDEEIAEAITSGAPPATIRAIARAGGMTTLREDGFEKVLAGLTTFDEINAVTRRRLV